MIFKCLQKVDSSISNAEVVANNIREQHDFAVFWKERFHETDQKLEAANLRIKQLQDEQEVFIERIANLIKKFGKVE